jgi:hypothetical protein
MHYVLAALISIMMYENDTAVRMHMHWHVRMQCHCQWQWQCHSSTSASCRPLNRLTY